MDVLNDDCLIHIFKYLDLSEQIKLVHYHDRFLNIMPFVWRAQCKHLVICLHNINMDIMDFDFFIGSIHKIVEVVSLKWISDEEFNILCKYVFPKAHDLSFSQRSPQFLRDDDMLRIIKSFPNIRSFAPHGHFSGKHWTKLKQLQHLVLSNCNEKFQIKYFAEIIAKFKLKTLKLDLFTSYQIEQYQMPIENITEMQTIKVDCRELSWFENKFQYMPKLQEIIITCIDLDTLTHVCFKLAQAGRKNIQSLESCNTDGALWHVINAGLNVDTIKIITDSSPLMNILQINFDRFKSLRQILFNACFFGDKHQLSYLFYEMPDLELLCLEECDCKFGRFDIITERVVQARTKHLIIRLLQNIAHIENRNFLVEFTCVGESPLVSYEFTNNDDSYSFEPIRILLK